MNPPEPYKPMATTKPFFFLYVVLQAKMFARFCAEKFGVGQGSRSCRKCICALFERARRGSGSSGSKTLLTPQVCPRPW